MLVLVAQLTVVTVLLEVRVTVFGCAVTIFVSTPLPNVTVSYLVLVDTGSVIVVLDVTSFDLVM